MSICAKSSLVSSSSQLSSHKCPLAPVVVPAAAASVSSSAQSVVRKRCQLSHVGGCIRVNDEVVDGYPAVGERDAHHSSRWPFSSPLMVSLLSRKRNKQCRLAFPDRHSLVPLSLVRFDGKVEDITHLQQGSPQTRHPPPIVSVSPLVAAVSTVSECFR